MENNISSSKKAVLKRINKKLVMVKNAKALATFNQEIQKILTGKNSYTKLVEFDKKLELLSDEINTLRKIKENQPEAISKSKIRKIELPKQVKDTIFNVILKDFKVKHATHLPFIYCRKAGTIQIKVTEKDTSKDTIKKLGNRISVYLKQKGIDGMIGMSLKYHLADHGSWRSGRFVPIGENVHLYDEMEQEYEADENQETFDDFIFYIIETSRPDAPLKVGESDYNDCVFDCLYKCLYDALPWKTPADFKSHFKLRRGDKVPVALFDKIEEKLKNIKINISGDYTRESKIKSNKIIRLIIDKEHCINDFRREMDKISRNNICFNARKPIMYDTATFMAYNGINEWKLSKAERNEFFNVREQKEYILINKMNKIMSENDYKKFRGGQNYLEWKNNKSILRADKVLTLKEQYQKWIDDANLLKKETKGLINLYKTGNDKFTILDLFDKYAKHIENPPNIYELEAEFISGCCGAMINAEQYEGPAYDYDFISKYPATLCDVHFMIPMDEGDFYYLSQNDLNEMQFFKYGIYKAVINKSDDKNINKLFKFNYKNYYTHIELKRAKELKLNIELIIDDKPNFIHYASTTEKSLKSSEVFKQVINTIYPFKEAKLPRMKILFTMLWGSLCEKDHKTYTITNNDTEYIEIENTEDLVSIKPFDDNKTTLIYKKKDKSFKTGWARLQPFLIAKGKYDLSKTMEPYINDVVRYHTDGFTTKSKPEGIITGDKMGDLKYKGYCENAIVVNCNKVIGEFV